MVADHPKYLLRWRFVYSDHKTTKSGMWNYPGDFDTEKAWCQSKENLLVAKIEGKDFITREIVTLAQVDGHDFVNLGWISSASIPGIKIQGSKKLEGRIIGLMLVSRKQKVKIFTNGQAEIEDHNIDYGRINLAGFGR